MDYFAVSRVISGVDNTYDNIRDPIFSLVRSIRRKSIGDLKKILIANMKAIEGGFNRLSDITYNSLKRQDLLHLLARIASYIEDGVEQTNKVGFSVYIDRRRGNKNFDVEHLLPFDYREVLKDLGEENDFVDLKDFHEKRNNIGALILLPRGRNRSIQSKVYSEKLSVYATENILAQSLTNGFYRNNPQIEKFNEVTGINLEAIAVCNKENIVNRVDLYLRTARKIWSFEALGAIVPE